jgi:predicted dinucleotide-binding enzyme
MRIGILGSGLMGGKLGTLFAKAGHDVVFSYARSQRKLNRLAREAGSRAAAGTPREAAEGADALLLAVHLVVGRVCVCPSPCAKCSTRFPAT